MKRKSNNQFLLELEQNHPTLEALEEYKNGRTKMMIRCKKCSYIFSARPSSLYMGHGCPNCVGLARKTEKQFKKELSIVRPDMEVIGEYYSTTKKTDFRCKVCGHVWNTTPNAVLHRTGCPVCAGTLKKTHELFIKQMSVKHPTIQVIGKYQNNRVKVQCKCLQCGELFMGIPHAMIDSMHGCPRCSCSKGEKRIQNWLKENKIQFLSEYRFSDCKALHPLPFDFYIPSKNLIIEYDGKQHYEINEFFGGKEAFEKLKTHDDIKNQYCIDKHIRLLRIPYWDFDKIDEILKHTLTNS